MDVLGTPCTLVTLLAQTLPFANVTDEEKKPDKTKHQTFYHAMLCTAVLAMALCLSVRLSVTSRSSTKTAKT